MKHIGESEAISIKKKMAEYGVDGLQTSRVARDIDGLLTRLEEAKKLNDTSRAVVIDKYIAYYSLLLTEEDQKDLMRELGCNSIQLLENVDNAVLLQAGLTSEKEKSTTFVAAERPHVREEKAREAAQPWYRRHSKKIIGAITVAAVALAAYVGYDRGRQSAQGQEVSIGGIEYRSTRTEEEKKAVNAALDELLEQLEDEEKGLGFDNEFFKDKNQYDHKAFISTLRELNEGDNFEKVPDNMRLKILLPEGSGYSYLPETRAIGEKRDYDNNGNYGMWSETTAVNSQYGDNEETAARWVEVSKCELPQLIEDIKNGDAILHILDNDGQKEDILKVYNKMIKNFEFSDINKLDDAMYTPKLDRKDGPEEAIVSGFGVHNIYREQETVYVPPVYNEQQDSQETTDNGNEQTGEKDPDPVEKDPDPIEKDPDPIEKDPDPIEKDPEPTEEEETEEVEEINEGSIKNPEKGTGGGYGDGGDNDKEKPVPGGDKEKPGPGGDKEIPEPGGDKETPQPGGDKETPETTNPQPGGDKETPETTNPGPGGDKETTETTNPQPGGSREGDTQTPGSGGSSESGGTLTPGGSKEGEIPTQTPGSGGSSESGGTLTPGGSKEGEIPTQTPGSGGSSESGEYSESDGSLTSGGSSESGASVFSYDSSDSGDLSADVPVAGFDTEDSNKEIASYEYSELSSGGSSEKDEFTLGD